MAKGKMGRAIEERRRKRAMKKTAIGIVRDVILAVVIVIVVMGTLYAYCGVWPPMVVVESQSMMHGTDSQIGIIDTGDLTLVKKIDSRQDITTYVEARPSYTVEYLAVGQNTTTTETFHGAQAGLQDYGDYGNVVIYRPDGSTVDTPIIHRAIAWFEPNTTKDCKVPMGFPAGGDFPDIKNAAHPNGLRCVIALTIQDVGYGHNFLQMNVQRLTQDGVNVEGAPFAGLLTHGDYNFHGGNTCDQESIFVRSTSKPIAPTKIDWVVGKAVGELPWFGALKLVASGTPTGNIPQSSWTGLITTIVLILVVPFILDIIVAQYRKRKAKTVKGKKRPASDSEE